MKTFSVRRDYSVYGSIEGFMAAGNSLEALCEYDFKNESPWPDVVGETEPIKKFQLYKGKKEPPFDCDRCKFAMDLYTRLWGWSYGRRGVMPESLSSRFGGRIIGFGSDTMNSFATVYRTARNIYYQSAKSPDANKRLAQFAALTHTAGNLTLVPYQLDPVNDKRSFNSYRGYRGEDGNKYFVYDFFDLSLKLIQEYLGQETFQSYIDVFLLNDYVDKSYRVIPLIKSHKKPLKAQRLPLDAPESFLPQSEQELNEFLDNVISRIQARGMRITARLKANGRE